MRVAKSTLDNLGLLMEAAPLSSCDHELAPWRRPLQREAVEKARRKINGGAKLRFRAALSSAAPFFHQYRAVQWGEKSVI